MKQWTFAERPDSITGPCFLTEMVGDAIRRHGGIVYKLSCLPYEAGKKYD